MALIKCSNCGRDASDQARNCMYCKAQLSGVPSATKGTQSSLSTTQGKRNSANGNSQVKRKAVSQGDNTNRLLAHGSGRGSSAIKYYWVVCIICAIVSGLVFFIVLPAHERNQFFTRYVGKIALENIWFIIGAVAVVLFVISGAIMNKCVAKTEIKVFTNSVEGKAVGKFFLVGDLRTFSFRLNYSQITSVDVTNSAVIIHAANAQYKCYVANGSEIQNTVFQRL